MVGSLLSAANWPIVGQICWVLGKVMNFIYTMLDSALPSDTGLVGISIILYTILVYTLMLPMTINQQRSSKMQAVVQPEVMAIQKKYKNKKDQASMLKQQEEIQQVYDKYGVSMMGGCLPLLIQMPFLFALYPVIYNISNYVPDITAQANKFLTIPDMTITPGNMLSMAKSGETMGYSAAALVITAILLPVLSAFTQYLNMKLSMAVNGSNRPVDKDDPTAATMRTMNMTMPLFSLVMVFTLPTGIGIYWIVSAIVRMVQQVFINKHLSKMSVDDMIEKNKEKAQKKKESVKTETKNEFKKEHKKEKDFKKAPKKEVREETELAKVEPATIEACEKFVEDVLNAMNMEEVKVTSTVDEEGALSITMEGKNMGILIGKRGQTLDSLQYLTNRVANKMQDGYVRVKLDTEDYRRRRKETLENLAKNIASKVKRTRRTVALEPMNPYERRIIHSALQSDPAVSTHSEGEEPYRKVVVTLARRSGGSHNYEKYDK